MRPPASENELIARAKRLTGKTLGELAREANITPPLNLTRAKGWVGELFEVALGASAGSRPVPDFEDLGIELKSLPINLLGKPKESTYVCVVPMHDVAGLRWEDSLVKKKLSRVLWIPIEADAQIALPDRRIGHFILWSPTDEDEAILRADWEEYMDIIALGRIDAIDARLGTYLQVRPKAMNSRALTSSADEDGHLVASLPRGFYLRPKFTVKLLQQSGSKL